MEKDPSQDSSNVADQSATSVSPDHGDTLTRSDHLATDNPPPPMEVGSRLSSRTSKEGRRQQGFVVVDNDAWGGHWDAVFAQASEERLAVSASMGSSQFASSVPLRRSKDATYPFGRRDEADAWYESWSANRESGSAANLAYSAKGPSVHAESEPRPFENEDLTASHIFTNKEIVETARARPKKFAEFVEYLISTERPLNMVNVATILYSTGKLRTALTDDVVQALREKIMLMDDNTFNTKTLSNALYGMQRFTGTEEVRKLVAVLATLVDRCEGSFRTQHVGNTMYGLQRLGDSREVRALVKALAPKIAQCEEELNAQAVSNALYGMQSLHDSPELRLMLVALAGQVQQCTEELSAQHVGNALYGLQNLTPSEELKLLLHALIPLVEKTTVELNGQAVGNALCGIQKLGDMQETRWLMSVLTPKVEQCKIKLKSREWNFAMYSMQRLPPCPELDGLIRAMSQEAADDADPQRMSGND
jgi:hypothetical protein